MTEESRLVIENFVFGDDEAERLASALVRKNVTIMGITETALRLQAL